MSTKVLNSLTTTFEDLVAVELLTRSRPAKGAKLTLMQVKTIESTFVNLARTIERRPAAFGIYGTFWTFVARWIAWESNGDTGCETTAGFPECGVLRTDMRDAPVANITTLNQLELLHRFHQASQILLTHGADPGHTALRGILVTLGLKPVRKPLPKWASLALLAKAVHAWGSGTAVEVLEAIAEIQPPVIDPLEACGHLEAGGHHRYARRMAASIWIATGDPAAEAVMRDKSVIELEAE